MLTRLRVQGFKNLLDVDVRLGPFTCVAGLNGTGKSNLFDAIRFLSLLTRYPIMEAVKLLREAKGRSPEPRSLFTTFEGFRAPEMRFSVEMIVAREVEDDFGVTASAATSALEYELAFRLDETNDLQRLELARETLAPIKIGEARKRLGFPSCKEYRETAFTGRRGAPLISTSLTGAGPQITVHQEGHGGRKLPAPKSSRTVIGGTASSDFPTVLAARKEMQSWQTLMLEPSAMRAPSFYRDQPRIDSRGANLPAALARLAKADERNGTTYAELANRLSELIDDIHELTVRDDERTETLTLEVRGRDGVFHPARSLSDGTLRFLVLAALSLDPQADGLICLEEPENGIHPERIEAMVQLLKDLAVDPDYAIGSDNPLRQVVVNTHSPEVVKSVSPHDLLYLEEVQVIREGNHGRVAHIRVPEGGWRAGALDRRSVVARGQIRPYLRGLKKGQKDAQMWLDFVED